MDWTSFFYLKEKKKYDKNIIEWFHKHDTLNLPVARVEFVSGVEAHDGRGEGVVP